MKLTRCKLSMLAFSCLLVFSPATIGPAHAKDLIEQAGNDLLFALPAATVGLALFKGDITGLWEYGLSSALSQGSTFGLKYSVHELRPNGRDYLSFPSGHSSATFTAAEFLWKRYGWQYGAPAFALATFTAYSRVESRNHFVHDVAAGAALGFFSSYIFTKPFHGVQIAPVTDGRSFGIIANGTF
jgi:membrane-associated phospholipid phosphatase